MIGDTSCLELQKIICAVSHGGQASYEDSQTIKHRMFSTHKEYLNRLVKLSANKNASV